MLMCEHGAWVFMLLVYWSLEHLACCQLSLGHLLIFIPSINAFNKQFCDNLLILLGQHECFLVIFAVTRSVSKIHFSYTAFFSVSTVERLFVLCSRLRHSLCWPGLRRAVLL